ncbi:MAG: hypothetical protein GWN56_11635, partial [Nitrosopumilaceae archaeon]|nr:hypothetical protein [Nitrosopumilaceae archaeon]NIV66190.1 hypothetical protein [Nitrosopumilaceae archaeon]
TEISNREKLINLLSSDLNFHNQKSEFLSHNYHSFPAKFPPQLPRKFILELIQKNDVILDPMMGSGTTILEGFLLGRKAIGFDIDPLAVLILRVKTLPMNLKTVARQARSILKEAKEKIESDVQKLEDLLHKRWDIKTKEFVDNWFSHKTQLELIALQSAIESFDDKAIKSFFKLMFSSLIITKSGGVSFALDLAHTRPHKAKIVYTSKGEKLLGQDLIGVHPPRLKLHTKTLRSVIDEFEKKCDQSLNSWREARLGKFKPVIDYGDAQNLPLNHQSVDLIVT